MEEKLEFTGEIDPGYAHVLRYINHHYSLNFELIKKFDSVKYEFDEWTTFDFIDEKIDIVADTITNLKYSLARLADLDAVLRYNDTNKSTLPKDWRFMKKNAYQWTCLNDVQDHLKVIESFLQKYRPSSVKVYTSNGEKQLSIDMGMIFIEGGAYMLGVGVSEKESFEIPIHEVFIKNFYMSRYMITNEIWYAVMEENIPDKHYEPHEPITYVSYHKIQEFISRLNDLTGKKYRLTSEEEWNYVANEGIYFGKYVPGRGDKMIEEAWVEDEELGRPRVVGLKRPNRLGIHDIMGNLWEWCKRWEDEEYHAAFQKEALELCSSWSSFEVVLGGCWGEGVDKNYRSFTPHEGVQSLCGFRLVLDAE